MREPSLREKRHVKIRRKVSGTSFRPRLSVFRSSQYIYAQIIDDTSGKTLAFESDIKIDKKDTKSNRAFEVGKKLAEKALKKGVQNVVFDRGGFLYRGRIERLSAGAREGGLKF